MQDLLDSKPTVLMSYQSRGPSTIWVHRTMTSVKGIALITNVLIVCGWDSKILDTITGRSVSMIRYTKFSELRLLWHS